MVGQCSGITWHYVQMLATVPGVKPDLMICRHVAHSLALPRNSIAPEFEGAIVTATAEDMKVSPTDLGHAIWQWQRVQR